MFLSSFLPLVLTALLVVCGGYSAGGPRHLIPVADSFHILDSATTQSVILLHA
jgi:hypothetical protein